MSKADYFRPAWYQVHQVARCQQCGREAEYSTDQSVDDSPCFCGGRMRVAGESYPASVDGWDEERSSVDGPWRQRR